MSIFWYFIIAYFVIMFTWLSLKERQARKIIEAREPALSLWSERFPGKEDAVKEFLQLYYKHIDFPEALLDRISPDDRLLFFEEMQRLTRWSGVDGLDAVELILELEERTGKDMPYEVAMAANIGEFFEFFYCTEPTEITVATLHGLDEIRDTLGHDSIIEASPGEYTLSKFNHVLDFSLTAPTATYEKQLTLLLSSTDYPGFSLRVTMNDVTALQRKSNPQHILALKHVSDNQPEQPHWHLHDPEHNTLDCQAQAVSIELIKL